VKPLRQLLDREGGDRGSAADPPSHPPVPLLAAVARPRLVPDLTVAFDRTLFGMSADEVRALDHPTLHALELGWEALERSGLQLRGLTGQRIGVWSDGRAQVEIVADAIGATGRIVHHEADDAALIGLMEARAAVLAGDVDAALVFAGIGDEGLGCVIVGQPGDERFGLVGWLVAVAAGRVTGPDTPVKVAVGALARSGLEGAARTRARGMDGVMQALAGDGPATVAHAGPARCVCAILRPSAPPAAEGAGPRLLALSTRSKGTLRQLVAQVAAALETDEDLRSIATDASRRPALERRLAVPTTSADAVRARLERWLEGDRDAATSGRSTDRGITFVFPPAGAQYPNMAVALYDTEPAFRAAVMRCDRGLRRRLPRPLLSLLFPQPGRELRLDDPLFANPVTFVLSFALAQLLRSWGVQPEAVVGCGVGEIVAAVVSGAIELDHGLLLAVERGRLLRSIEEPGGRLALTGSEGQVRELLEQRGLAGLDVVAVPVPDRAVVGGPRSSIDALAEELTEQGLRCERLAGHPAHTSLVDPVLDAYRAVGEAVPSQAPTDVRWASTVTGEAVTTSVSAEHWLGSLRGPMRFAVACEDAYFHGVRTFIELAPRPVMVGAGRRTLSHLPVRWASALHGADHDDRASLVEALAVLWTRGPGQIVDPGVRGSGAPLPPTPLDRRHVDAMEEVTPPPPLFEGRGDTLVPDEPLPDDLQAMVDEATGEDDEPPAHDGPPAIAPPIITDDKTIDEEGRLSDRDEDIASFFSEDASIHDAEAEPASDDSAPVEAEGDDAEPAEPDPEAADPDEAEAPPGSEDAEAPPADTPSLDTTPYVRGPQRPLHEVWEPAPLGTADIEGATWIVLTDEEGLGDYLLALLTAAGHDGLRVVESQPYPRGDGTIFVPDPSAEGAWDIVLDRLGTLTGPVRVIHLWALDSEAHTEPWLALIRLLHTFRFRGLNVPTYLVTRGLFGDEPSVPAALLWGAGRQLQVESPEQWGGAIDLDEDEDAEALLAHLLERAAPTEVAFRGGERLARRLSPEDGSGEEPTLDMAGAWVLAGGVDTTTLTLVDRLVSRGATRLVLLSSDPPGAKAMMQVLALKKEGVEVTLLRANLRDGDERARVFQRVADQGDVSGVIVRLALSQGPVLGSDDTVGRDEVAILDAVPELLELRGERIVWMPAEAIDPHEGSGWTAVVGPAVVQIAKGRGAAVVSGAFDGEEAVDSFLRGLRPREVVVLPD